MTKSEPLIVTIRQPKAPAFFADASACQANEEIMMNEQDEKLQDMMSEIEVLESEMMEVLSGLHNLSGKRLEKARLTLAEICAEYEIQVADLEIELNVKTLLPDRETLRANCFARAKRIKLFVCASAPITEQLRLM